MKARLSQIRFAILLGIVAAISGGQRATADVLMWSGSGGATWDISSVNWSGGTTPWDPVNGPVNVADFTAGGDTPNVSGTIFANGITFDNTATVSGGTITLSGASPTITANANATIGSFLTGTAGLTTTGPAMLTLTGNNSFTGGTTLTAGTLSVAGGGATTTDSLILQGGALNLSNGTVTTSGGGTFGVGYDVLGTTGVVTVGSGGVLNVGASGGRTFIGGSNNDNLAGSGTLTVNAGGLFSVAAAGAFPNDNLYLAGYGGTGVLNLNGGTLSLARGISSGGTSFINVLAGGAIINAQSNVTIGPALLSGASPDGGLTKIGTGTLTLNAVPRYNGPTAINAGTLLFNVGSGPATHATGTITVNSGGTLAFTSGVYYQLGGTSPRQPPPSSSMREVLCSRP